MDGEPLGVPSAVLDDHLATCTDCARWSDDAVRLTRQVRLQATAPPDLSDRIVADVARPAGVVLRRRALLRAALVLVGLAQVGISVPPLFGASIDMAMAVHAAHETAAWNLALGFAFLATAAAPRRAAGLAPVLLGFVVVLGALSVRDELTGAVTAGRLLTHVGVLAGLLVVLALGRTERDRPVPAPVDAAVPDRSQQPPDLRGVA